MPFDAGFVESSFKNCCALAGASAAVKPVLCVFVKLWVFLVVPLQAYLQLDGFAYACGDRDEVWLWFFAQYVQQDLQRDQCQNVRVHTFEVLNNSLGIDTCSS